MFSQPNHLEIAIKNLEAGINDRAYIRKSQSLIMEFYGTLKEEVFEVYRIISQYHIGKLQTSMEENILLSVSTN